MSISSATMTVYTTADGEQFHDLKEAEAHQAKFENQEIINIRVQSFLNSKGLIGRSRKQKESVATDMVEFLLSFDDVMIEQTVNEEEEAEEAPVAKKTEEKKADLKVVKNKVEKVESFDEDDSLFIGEDEDDFL